MPLMHPTLKCMEQCLNQNKPSLNYVKNGLHCTVALNKFSANIFIKKLGEIVQINLDLENNVQIFADILLIRAQTKKMISY